MSHTLIRGLRGPGRSATRDARRTLWRAGRLLAIAAGLVRVSGAIVPAEAAVPGDLTLATCNGDPAGCTPAFPFGGVGDVAGVAVDGWQVYTVSPGVIGSFTMDSAGNLNWLADECYSNSPTICEPSPPGGGNAVTVNAAGTQLYTTTSDALGGAVSH